MVEDVRDEIHKKLTEASSGVPELGIPPLSLPAFKPREDMPESTERLAQEQAREIAPAGMPAAPAPSAEEPVTLLTEDLEQISEAIIAEKWKTLTADLDKMHRWQEMAERNMQIMHNNMLKMEQKMNSIDQAIFQKVDAYGKGITDVGTELKAMQKVFQTVMPEFTSNIKELQDLVGEVKTKVRAKPARRVTKRKTTRKRK